MDCSDFRKMASKKLDGVLGEEDIAELESHISECADCGSFMKLIVEAALIHREMTEIEPPAGLRGAVMASIEGKEAQERFGGRYKIAVSAAAVLILLAGIGTGNFIKEAFTPADLNSHVEQLELEYLDEYPPNSLGEVLMALSGENSDEQ